MAEEFYGVRHSAIFYEIAVDHPDMPGVGHVGGNLDYMLARVDGNKDLRVHRIPVAKQPFLLVIEAKRKSALNANAIAQVVAEVLTLDYMERSSEV